MARGSVKVDARRAQRRPARRRSGASRSSTTRSTRRPARSRSRARSRTTIAASGRDSSSTSSVTLTTDPTRDRRADRRPCRPASRASTCSSSSRTRRWSCARSTVARADGTETVIKRGAEAGRNGRDRRPAAARPGQPRQHQVRSGSRGHAMNLSALFIKRPVTTTLIMLGIVVFGADGLPAAAGQRPADRRLPHHPGAARACRARAPRRWRRRWRCRSRSSSRRSPGSTRSTRRARRAARTSRCSSI